MHTQIQVPSKQIEWEKHSTFEHRAHRGGRLVGLVTRPVAGVFWAHRISWSPATGKVDEHGAKTRHRTLTAAKAAIERDAPEAPEDPDTVGCGCLPLAA